MRAVVLLLAIFAAFVIWRVQAPASPYAATAPIERRPPLEIQIVERPRK